jgi:uncharacterized protein (DUF58 family)
MLIPSLTLVRLLLLWLVAAIAASIWPAALQPWLIATGVAGSVAGFDLLLLLLLPRPKTQRKLPGSAALNVRLDVHVRLSNPGAAPLRCEVFDHHPREGVIEGLPRPLSIPARGWSQMTYRLRPTARGNLQFGPVEVRLSSPLWLWQRRLRLGEPSVLRVYPNFAALSGYALLATDHRLAAVGILQRRRRGEGMDFDQLREYREGDSQRKIDWKASQRMGKLISREYQDERDQQILFLVDCGRRMRAKDDDCSHFDHALDATLLLAYVGLRQGDAVGLLTMSGEERFLAPHKSREMVHRILNTVYDLQPSLLTSDYYQAAVSLSKRLRKRALIVIISNLRDEDDDTLLPALRLLQKRHLVLFASLREKALDEAVDIPVQDYDTALTHAAAIDYRLQRDAAFRRLQHGNVVCLDVPPQKLPVALVNQYLEVKRSGRL